MSQEYNGFTIPAYTDTADAVAMFQNYTDDVTTKLAAKSDKSSPLVFATDGVDTFQSTTSTSYTDLATVGPSVTLTTGTKALVIVTSRISCAAVNDTGYVSFAVSGATSVSAIDAFAMRYAVNYALKASNAYVIAGLTAGTNTFTLKYKTGSGTSYFDTRQIIVVNLGS